MEGLLIHVLISGDLAPNAVQSFFNRYYVTQGCKWNKNTVFVTGQLHKYDRTLHAALYTMKTQWFLYCKFTKALTNMCYNETHMFY